LETCDLCRAFNAMQIKQKGIRLEQL